MAASPQIYRVTWDGKNGTVRVHGSDHYFGHPLDDGLVGQELFRRCLSASGAKDLADSVIAIGALREGETAEFTLVQRARDGQWWRVQAHAEPLAWDERGVCVLCGAVIRGEPCDPPEDAPSDP